MYTIYDTKTKITSGSYKTLSTANRSVDRKNLEYGAYRYIVKQQKI